MATVPGDNPIEGIDDDQLGRRDFARSLAQTVRIVDSSRGYVFGLLGPWGSGKTSILNMIKSFLSADPPLTVIDFNPWLFSGDSLVDSFLRELAAQLDLKDSKKFSKVVEQVDKYSGLLTPLTLIPVVGPWAGRVKTIAGIAKIFKAEKGKSSTEAQKKNVSDALAELERPIAVIIDDIDRLSQREVQDIFRLCSTNCQFSKRHLRPSVRPAAG